MKISKRSVDALALKGERYFVWDESLSGFGIRIGANGRKTFICRYRNGNIRRQVKLGNVGTLTAEEARDAAKKVLASVTLGEDPAAERDAKREAVTLSQLVDLFIAGHGPKLKPTSLAGYQSGLNKHVLPVLGKRPAEAITTKDVNKIHIGLVEHPSHANRVIAYLSSVFSWGADNGYVPETFNPTRAVKRFKEQGRQRYLSEEELARLGSALVKAETKGLPWTIKAKGDRLKHVAKDNQTIIYPSHVTNAIRLLLMTGCRLREILHLQWKEVDIGRGLLFLPDSKTGRKTVILNRSAIAILESMERTDQYVILGDIPDQPRHDLKRPWTHIRAAAELKDVRLHDLRHTHASIGAMAGFGLPIVGKLLGHASSMTTQRYAHIADDPARRASDAIGLSLEKMMGAETTRLTGENCT
ncbi:MAG: tyrosine-type recombinase/integrase [Roseibium sp.]|uniref:tyrosine-type recombinase/integrase n=1 Tax=Roseibium sp. TaxID=1936156 RepID=UPI0026202563|nr:site-specific integrase [Roseibium sp.]MCV0427696.1 tyrosine-type recombinase/integrase [Roseibium sp.]